MAEQSPKQYLAMIDKGGLVPRESLLAAVAELQQQAGEDLSVEQISAHLIRKKLITTWHDEKLRAGRYRGFFLGKYKLLSLLGSGGMCSVYLAEHKILHHLRAIKVLPRSRVSDKSYLDRFYREGRAAAALNHPHIVRVYDIDHEGETHYLVMEYVEGANLYDYVKQHGPLGFAEAIDYLLQAAIALQHAHDLGLVHRDVKPANLLITDSNVLKISDLGLALFREDDYSLTMVHNERVLGTADYLAPEQAVNSHNVDHRADIYGLGCSLYYVLTGSPPFPTGSLAQRIAMHQTAEPAPLVTLRPDCPPDISQLCERMMKKSPADRFQDCRQLQQALRKILERLQGNVAATASQGAAAQAVPPPARPAARTSPQPVASAALPAAAKTGPPHSAPKPPTPQAPAPQRPVTRPDSENKPRGASPPAYPTPRPAAPAAQKPGGASGVRKSTPAAAATSPGRPGSSAVASNADIAQRPGAPGIATPSAGPFVGEPSKTATVRAEELNVVAKVRPASRRRSAQRQQWILIVFIAVLALLLALVVYIAFRLTVGSSSSTVDRHDPQPQRYQVLGDWVLATSPAGSDLTPAAVPRGAVPIRPAATTGPRQFSQVLRRSDALNGYTTPESSFKDLL